MTKEKGVGHLNTKAFFFVEKMAQNRHILKEFFWCEIANFTHPFFLIFYTFSKNPNPHNEHTIV